MPEYRMMAFDVKLALRAAGITVKERAMNEQNSRVKIALDALGRMMWHHDEWVEIARRYRFVPGVKEANRQALRCKALGLVFHDRILNRRPL